LQKFNNKRKKIIMKNIKKNLLLIPILASFGSVNGMEKNTSTAVNELSDALATVSISRASGATGAGAGVGSCCSAATGRYHIDQEIAEANRARLSHEEQAPLNEKLLQASEGGNVASASDAIIAGANLDAENQDGDTALIAAAIKNRTEIARLLIDTGANLNRVDRFGSTALMMAARYNHHEIAEILIGAGANLELADQYGCTALMAAAYHNHPEIARLLIAADATVDRADQYGNTALMRTVYHNSHEIAQLLIDAGANVNAADQDGDTALMKAVCNNRPEIARLLIAADANVDLADQYGCTALMLAARWNNPEIAQLLIEANANPAIKTNPTDQHPEGQFAHELVLAGYTDKEIEQNNALKAQLEKHYDTCTNPLW